MTSDLLETTKPEVRRSTLEQPETTTFKTGMMMQDLIETTTQETGMTTPLSCGDHDTQCSINTRANGDHDSRK
jgi:hypothetical protein